MHMETCDQDDKSTLSSTWKYPSSGGDHYLSAATLPYTETKSEISATPSPHRGKTKSESAMTDTPQHGEAMSDFSLSAPQHRETKSDFAISTPQHRETKSYFAATAIQQRETMSDFALSTPQHGETMTDDFALSTPHEGGDETKNDNSAAQAPDKRRRVDDAFMVENTSMCLHEKRKALMDCAEGEVNNVIDIVWGTVASHYGPRLPDLSLLVFWKVFLLIYEHCPGQRLQTYIAEKIREGNPNWLVFRAVMDLVRGDENGEDFYQILCMNLGLTDAVCKDNDSFLLALINMCSDEEKIPSIEQEDFDEEEINKMPWHGRCRPYEFACSSRKRKYEKLWSLPSVPSYVPQPMLSTRTWRCSAPNNKNGLPRELEQAVGGETPHPSAEGSQELWTRFFY